MVSGPQEHLRGGLEGCQAWRAAPCYVARALGGTKAQPALLRLCVQTCPLRVVVLMDAPVWPLLLHG